MRKIDWVLIGLIGFVWFYWWYIHQAWYDYAKQTTSHIATQISDINNRLDVRQDCESKWDAQIKGLQNKIQQLDKRTQYSTPTYEGEF